MAAGRRRVTRQSDLQRTRNRVRNLVLDREDVRPLAVVAFGPEMKAVGLTSAMVRKRSRGLAARHRVMIRASAGEA